MVFDEKILRPTPNLHSVFGVPPAKSKKKFGAYLKKGVRIIYGSSGRNYGTTSVWFRNLYFRVMKANLCMEIDWMCKLDILLSYPISFWPPQEEWIVLKGKIINGSVYGFYNVRNLLKHPYIHISDH